MADETWVRLRHEETGGTQLVHNHPEAIAAQEARGWSVVVEDDEPERAVFVPTPTDGDEPVEWVDLVHPDLPTGTNRVPNNAAAIAGAVEAGWTYPEPPAVEVEDAPEPLKRPRRNETPAVDAGNDEPAGDGAQQKEKP